MPSVYPKLQELLGRARLTDLNCTLEFEGEGPVGIAMIPDVIGKALPGWRATPLPNGQALWMQGGERSLRWLPPVLMSAIKAKSTGNLDADVVEAFNELQRHGGKLVKRLSDLGTTRFAALVANIDFSSLDLPHPGPFIGSFIRAPADLGAVVDGEFRFATKDARYFTNWGLSTFETRNVRLEGMVGPAGPIAPLDIKAFTVVDMGLRLRVDVNTKVNQHEGTGSIEVTESDVEALRLKGIAAARKGLDFLRQAL